MFEIFGLPPAAGAPPLALIDAQFDGRRALQQAREAVRGGQVLESTDLSIVRADGQRRQIRFSAGHERVDGAIRATYGVAADITGFADALAEAEQKERLLTAFIDHAPAALAMLDREMRYMRVSPRWLSDYDLGEQDLVGRSHYDVFPEIPSHWKDIHARCLAGAVERCDREMFVRANGQRQWLAWEVRPWLDRTGAIGGILMLTRDITDLVASMEALERSERRLQLALETGGMVVWERDRRTGKMAVAGATQKAPGLAGRSQITWDEIWNLVHPDDRAEMMKGFLDAVAARSVLSYEHRLTDDHEEHWVRSVIEPLFDESGAHIGALGLMKDISADKEKERLFARALETAESASKSKSAFLAVMSHELRTPLNGVMGVAQALSRMELAPRQRELTDLILSASRTLKRLVDDALDIGRIEADILTLESRPFAFAKTVLETCDLLEPIAREKGLGMTISSSMAADLSVIGDAVRVRQIVSNLVSNAIKFTPTGEVSIAVTSVSNAPDTVRINVAVRDTGIGLDAAARRSIFDGFSQVGKSMRGGEAGAGLGLAVARGLAAAMGGEILCDSEPGVGSTFTFRVQLACAEPNAPALPNATASSFAASSLASPIRILIAEDNPLNQTVLGLLLDAYHVDLSFVQDGESACRAARENMFDVALMDLEMPGIGGLNAIRTIRQAERDGGRARLPIVCITAQASTEKIAAAREAGADEYLCKPLTLEDLVAALARVLEGSAA